MTRMPSRNRLAAALVSCLAALPAVPAAAATLSLVGGASATLPTGCSTGAFNPVNFCSSNAAKATYLGLDPDAVMRPGSTVTKISATAKNANPAYGLVLDGTARVTFTYILKEAAYTNILAETTAGWNPLFNTASTAIGTESGSVGMGPGLLAFTLKTLSQALSFANDGQAQGKVSLAFSRIFNNGRGRSSSATTTSSLASTWRRCRCRRRPGCSSPASASPAAAGRSRPEAAEQGRGPRLRGAAPPYTRHDDCFASRSGDMISLAVSRSFA
jgi:hypothetical protein